MVGKKILRSSIAKLFFSKQEKKHIEAAIAEAEKDTSGEIRLHVTTRVNGDIMEEAKRIFEKIGMTKTKHRNAVLIFFAIANRSFVIIGDQGINDKIGQNGWDEIASKMQEKFKKDCFSEGVEEGVKTIGEVLKKYFQYDKDAVAELSNEISFG